MADTIDKAGLGQMILAAVEKIRANHQELSRLDSATGDGDHGTTMLRAMDAVSKAVAEAGEGDIKSLLHGIGWGIMCADGGSTGPLLGSLFMGMSEGAGDAESLDCAALAATFEAGLASMQKQSKAQVGDKTMMDALIPAVESLRTAADAGANPAAAMQQAAEAARKGAEATKDMQAKFGRARNLGERTLGNIDPGATSISYLFEGFSESISAAG